MKNGLDCSSPQCLLEAHQSALRCPYNSVSPVYHVAGCSVPEKFGDNCVSQAEYVANKVKTCTGVVNVSYLVDGRHHAVLCNYGADFYYFDPYLMHVDPISITKQQICSATARLDAYPFFREGDRLQKSWMEMTFSDVSQMVVRKGRFNPIKNDVSVSTFTYNIEQATHERVPKNDPAMAFAAEQTTLSLRVLEVERGETTHIVYPIHETHGQGIVDSNRLYIKDRCSRTIVRSSPAYEANLHEMANHLGVQPAEIEDFIMDGVSLYEQLAPKNIEYLSYNPTNQ